MSELNGQVILIDVNQIDAPEYPRYHSKEELAGLAADIKQNDRQIEEGIVEPNAQAAGGGKPWKLIVGWGRLQALPLIGWKQMRCLVVEGLTKLQKLQLTSSENNKRTNASPFFQAMLLKEMQNEIPEAERTQKKLAEISGFDESTVSEYLAISAIPEDLKEKLERSNFTFSQMTELIHIDNQDQLRKVAEKALKKELSSREIKAEVERLRKAAAKKACSKEMAQQDEPEVTLRVTQKKGKIKITASFPKKDDLNPIFLQLCGDTTLWCKQHPNTGRSKKQPPNGGGSPQTATQESATTSLPVTA